MWIRIRYSTDYNVTGLDQIEDNLACYIPTPWVLCDIWIYAVSPSYTLIILSHNSEWKSIFAAQAHNDSLSDDPSYMYWIKQSGYISGRIPGSHECMNALLLALWLSVIRNMQFDWDAEKNGITIMWHVYQLDQYWTLPAKKIGAGSGLISPYGLYKYQLAWFVANTTSWSADIDGNELGLFSKALIELRYDDQDTRNVLLLLLYHQTTECMGSTMKEDHGTYWWLISPFTHTQYPQNAWFIV